MSVGPKLWFAYMQRLISTHRIMIAQPVSSTTTNLKVFDWSGSDWVQIGNTLSVSDWGSPSTNIHGLAAVSASRVCATGSGILRMYDFDGTTISAVGNDGGFTATQTKVAALSASRVVVGAQQSGSGAAFSAFDFDETNFASASTGFNFGFGTTGVTYVAGMQSAVAAVLPEGVDEVGSYNLSGSTWALDGTALSVTTAAPKAIDSMTATRMVLSLSGTTTRAYDFNGSSWDVVGNSVAYSGALNDICALAEDASAMIYRRTSDGIVVVTPPITFNGTDWTESAGTTLELLNQTLIHSITSMSYPAPRVAA